MIFELKYYPDIFNYKFVSLLVVQVDYSIKCLEERNYYHDIQKAINNFFSSFMKTSFSDSTLYIISCEKKPHMDKIEATQIEKNKSKII